MCRGASHGGRRCPGQSTATAKKAAANRRRNNRRAKKNVKKFFATQGMDDTAEAVEEMTPAQIPGLLDAMGIDPGVLGEGVSVPVSANAPADKRSAEKILEIATQEAKSKDLTEFLVADEDATVPGAPAREAPTQEEIRDAFSALVAKSVDGPTHINGEKRKLIIDGIATDHVADLEGIYQLTNAMDLPDNVHERNTILKGILADINENIRNDYYPDFSKDQGAVENAILTAGDAPNKGVTAKIKKQIGYDYNGFTEMLYTDDKTGLGSEGIAAIQKVITGDATVRDFGGGFYYIEHNNRKGVSYGGFNYVYAPEGFKDLSTITVSPMSLFDEKPKKPSPILNGLGLNDLDEDTKRNLLSQEGIFRNVSRINIAFGKSRNDPESYYARDVSRETADRVVQEMLMGSAPELVSEDMDDLHASHRIAHGKSFIQQDMGVNVTLPEKGSVAAVRKFRMGLYPTATQEMGDEAKLYAREKVATTATTRSQTEEDRIRSEMNDEIASASPFVKKMVSENKVSEDAPHVIYDYTSNNYVSYALDSLDMEREKEFRDKNRQINDVIRAYQDQGTTPERTLFRGVRTPYGMDAKTYYDSVEVGEVVTTTKLTSSTYSSQSLVSFTGSENVVSVFHTKTGMPVESMSAYAQEKEVLIPAGQDYVCIGKEYDDNQGTYVFHYADKSTIEELD